MLGRDFAAFCNLAASAIGIGVLSFPYAFRVAGLDLGLAMCAVFCGINVFTALALLRACEACPRRTGGRGGGAVPDPAADPAPRSVEELALRTQGPRAELFAIACVLLNQFGQLVACLIVIGDLGSPTVASLLSDHWG